MIIQGYIFLGFRCIYVPQGGFGSVWQDFWRENLSDLIPAPGRINGVLEKNSKITLK